MTERSAFEYDSPFSLTEIEVCFTSDVGVDRD
jgi:hypothetical protein